MLGLVNLGNSKDNRTTYICYNLLLVGVIIMKNRSSLSLGVSLLILAFAFSQCSIDKNDSELESSFVDPMKSVVVVGTWGRAGKGGGVDDTIKTLRTILGTLGVPPENIYSQPWSKNEKDDDIPGPAPATSVHLDRLNEVESRLGSKKISYLAMIGHSFGGWAAARMSRSRKADSLFLLDPVIQVGYRDHPGERHTDAVYGVNYFQKESIEDLGTCPLGRVDLFNKCDYIGDVSCGQTFKYLSEGNRQIRFARNAEGRRKKTSCLGFSHYRKIAHTTIDDDKHLRNQIITKIISDIKKIKFENYSFRFRKHPNASTTIFHDVITLDQCRQKCDSDEFKNDCNAIVYHERHSGCYLKGGEIGGWVDWSDGDTYVRQRSYHLFQNQHPDLSETLYHEVMGLDECKEKCDSVEYRDRCKAFVYQEKYSGCYLKTGNIGGWSPWSDGDTFVLHK